MRSRAKALQRDWRFFTRWTEKRQAYAWGERPALADDRPSITSRAWGRIQRLNSLESPLDRARYLKGLLQDPSVGSKARLADLLGLSRPRVVQLLGVLDLPEHITEFLDEHKADPQVLALFNEKRLRSLRALATDRDRLVAFNQMMRRLVPKARSGRR